MKKLLLIIGVAAMAALGASPAKAGGVHFGFGLPLPPLPPLPGISIGIGGGYPGYGCAYPGYGYGYPGYGYSCPAPVYGGVPVYAPPVVVYHQPYYAPYYGYGRRVYVGPRAWGGYGWGRGRYYYRH